MTRRELRYTRRKRVKYGFSSFLIPKTVFNAFAQPDTGESHMNNFALLIPKGSVTFYDEDGKIVTIDKEVPAHLVGLKIPLFPDGVPKKLNND